MESNDTNDRNNTNDSNDTNNRDDTNDRNGQCQNNTNISNATNDRNNTTDINDTKSRDVTGARNDAIIKNITGTWSDTNDNSKEAWNGTGSKFLQNASMEILSIFIACFILETSNTFKILLFNLFIIQCYIMHKTYEIEMLGFLYVFLITLFRIPFVVQLDISFPYSCQLFFLIFTKYFKIRNLYKFLKVNIRFFLRHFQKIFLNYQKGNKDFFLVPFIFNEVIIYFEKMNKYLFPFQKQMRIFI
ncbi:hypothetical protein RFI_01431 [Reticulomyxa filosa]|uniref:Uncharacterized protein n=1 Tax=Reticulomyxa filosa TaxID=46433 RepID=X6PAR3_RETFI|nr:hypothetical protein RFI_01431 [Reticulomyxa filosa]|eukprot:ETO35630.1 hypothetical protein RFI_01431 [Reticulomyxa filosa]